MTNARDGASPWRRSVNKLAMRSRAAAAAAVRRLASGSTAVADQALATLKRSVDGGYHPIDGCAGAVAEAAIEVENLSVAYGTRLVLQGLSGRFAPASLTAVVGPNGGGKSSLMKALAGILPPRTGTIACTARAGPQAGHRLAYLPQSSELDRSYPIAVGELVALGAWRAYGSFRPVPQNLGPTIDEAIAAVGLEGLGGRPIGELSVGQFQRALFARLLLQDAAVILLDEPFAAVDESTIADLLCLVGKWHAEGRTVVAVLHDLVQVRRQFPSTLVLARECIAWGDTATTLTDEALTRARETMKAVAAPAIAA
jgi:zinc/manganese transport system ATP-binding protein